MANFDRLAELGQGLFLQHDQKEIIQKYHLENSTEKLYLNFCGDRYSIDRNTGEVCGQNGKPAGPAVTLAIFDMLCHSRNAVRLAGEWRTTNALPGGGQSSPDDALIGGRTAERFTLRLEALEQACRSFGGMRFPVGDVAWELPVFDWFPAVFQFWVGDDEFPSSARFLWDRDTLQYLHYETLYYIMGHLLDKLDRMI